MSKQPPPAPTASAKGPCPTSSKLVGRPGTGSLPSTFAPPDHHPRSRNNIFVIVKTNVFGIDGGRLVLGLFHISSM